MIQPAILGFWEVNGEIDPQSVERARHVLVEAAQTGAQVVTAEGVTFRWRPTDLCAVGGCGNAAVGGSRSVKAGPVELLVRLCDDHPELTTTAY